MTTPEDVSKANALFLEEASVASCSFIRSVGKDAILTELKTSAMVQHFMSTDGTVAMSSSFFALYEYKDGDAFKAGVTESVGHLPPHTTACVAFTRILPEHPVTFEPLEDNEAPTEEPKAVPLEPVTLSNVTFQSISLGQPLSSLKTNLVAIHEPLCRSNAGDNLVTSQIMELLGAIRSHESLMIDFKVSRYVHTDITNLCAEHPAMEVRDLITELGARANDNTFAKELQNLRGKCVSVFDVDVFNHKVGTFREEAAYWQHLDAWLEDIRNQLQSREFQLVQRILAKRGDATVEKTLMDKKVLVSEFHRFLTSIPHRAITDANRETLPAAVRQVFEQLSRSQKFPSDRLMKVADSIVDLITERALDIASECNLLFMKPNEAMQCLASIRAVFTEAQIGYTQTKDLRGGGVRRNDKQPTIARAVERIQLLHDFINSHFSLDSALTSIFATDQHEFIVTLRSEYATLQKGNSFLWELQGAGQVAFEAALKQYNTALDKLDDQLAHMVRNKLDTASSGEEMFRIHETFQKIRREKVKMIISNKHDELISLIGHTIDDIKRRYFDDDATSRAVVLGVAQGHSPLVANIKWHRSIEQALNEQLGKRDAVSQFGWHQLISLQTIDFNWVLNTQLLNFIGVTHADIMKDARMAAATPEVAGGALALAYLDLVYVDERPEWEKTINVGTAKQQLEKCDTSALTAASTVLRQLGVGSRHSTTHQSSRDSRMLKDKIHQGIRDNVRRWCTHVRNVLSQCTHDASTRNLNGKIFRLKGVYLEVQFPSEMTSLAADYNELTSAGLISQSNSEWDDVRMFIDNNSKKVQLATVLSQLLDLFYRKQELDEDGHIAELLMAEFDGVYELLLEGAKHRWSGFAVVENFVEKLASKMDDLCTQIDDVRAITSAIDDTLVIMEHDNCDPVKIGTHIADIKRLVNDLAIKTTTSQVFLHRLQPRVDDILCGHLQDIVYAWLEEFESLSSDPVMIQRTDAKTAKFGLSPLRVTVRVTKDDVRLDTFPFVWRNYWYDKFNESIDWINSIPHFDTQNELSNSVQNVKTYGTSYTRLVDKLPKGLLQKIYAAIEGVVTSTMVCEDHWRTHSQQVLHQDISEKVRTLTTLAQWQDAIVELREFAQEQMNDTRPLIGLGGVVVDAKDAQTSLKARFEQVETALLDRFGKVVSSQFAESLNVMRSHRQIVENCNLHGDTSEAIDYLRQVPVMEAYVKEINALLPTFKTSEKMLFSSSSFQIGPSWLSVEAVVSEYTTLCDLMAKRKEVIDRRKDELEHFVHSKVKAVQTRVEALERKYRQSNIADSDGPAAATLQAINDFYRDASEADQELKDVQQSQKALGFEEIHSSVLDSVLSDIKGQRQAYSSVKDLYDELEKLKETPFTEMQPRNLQQALYGLQEKMSNFNPAVRHFSAYTTLDTYIKELLANHRFIQDLRSDAILDRHWISLKNQLKMSSWVISSLTIGDIWNSKPVANSKIYHSVIDTAQGQHRLQVQIDQISDFWATHPLETTFFQNKVTLIKGWDSLFEKLEEDMNSLAAMKLSPFYGDTIAATANDWDDKLNRAHQILDSLVDVQRRWVYLDGIFAGSAEIRQQLPGEASQFDKTSREFVALMPRAKGEAITVIKLITVEKIQNNLEKIARELTTIQKKLGEYLETQRSRFPRFYFVGDEDLLEVIGNGKDPLLVAKHLKKMFCGVSQVTLEPTKDKGGNITSMISPEVESVAFDKPFDTAGMAIYEWLSKLEETMVGSLKGHVGDCLEGIPQPGTPFSDWIQKSPAQIVALCIQIQWVRMVEKAIKEGKDVGDVEKAMVGMLSQLATDVLQSGLDHISRHKTEQVITVAVYQRDKARSLAQKNIKDTNSFDWLSTMRPYFDGTGVNCKMADATIEYSFEYLGLAERLVQTALTDKCFLTLTQALHTRLGGSPAGPAGTGKTETVKALGMQLGRFVLVFCCDETFDFKSMGRIFVGLCQVGAWGCFDEFNRLEERILSAVSQQIQCIQEGLKSGVEDIILADRRVNIHANMGMFITMNPGYAGRSNLPDNLKQLFRGVAMTSPDRENIAEVMLFAQGFKTAEVLSKKIVPLFRLCRDQLSQQSHYDFGLRALKSVLVSAGGLKRAATARGDQDLSEDDEIRLMMQSLTETITPKLIAEDVTLFKALLRDVFPGCTPKEVPLDALEKAIKEEAASHQYIASDLWIAKIIQLYKILKVNHGIMLVGGSGCGKTSAWMTLLRALARVEDVDGHAYIIDPKALSKSELYGVLDPTTREWRDGVFTSTLRKIVDNVKGDDQSKKRHWIFFDGDVDPEWVENLNSLLDDNKLLTLPNGERLTLPPNVRIMFEVQDLRYATPATVSRCGMVWFSKETITHRHLLDHHVREFRSRSYCGKDETSLTFVERGSIQESRRDKATNDNKDGSAEDRELIKIQNKLADATVDYFKEGGIIDSTLANMEKGFTQFGIMEYNRAQSIRSFFTLFAHSAGLIAAHTEQTDKELTGEKLKTYAIRRLLLALMWGFASQYPTLRREEFSGTIKADIPGGTLLDYEVRVEDGEWSELRKRVVKTDIPATKVGTNDVVIPTVDTARHEDVISAWIRTGKPVILCGPPGSGKTMSLTAVLRASTQYEAAFLNFSSGTAPDTITKIFDQYCTIKSTLQGLILTPTSGKRLIVFCDEINLPSADKYGTQRVVQFLRQLTERHGYYRPKDNAWITLERIQFVGACNPPTDPGRVSLTHRFLRWAPVLFVDFPSYESLLSIYDTYCRGLLQKNLKLRPVASNLAKAMVDVYRASQDRFTAEIQRHYVYSPRELSRWSRAIFEGIQSLDEADQKNMTPDELVRLTVHEGLRLFRDRLTNEEEEQWTDDTMDRCFTECFPTIKNDTLARPILFSTVLTRAYTSSTRDQLRGHIREKLKAFANEELDVELVVFDAVVDHVIRIDRVLRQPLGHMLLVGAAGVGKTVLSRFVAWMNNLSVFQIKAHRGYTIDDFEEDLRGIMRRSGCKREKICFIFDESNIMDSNFLEYMNALLASGEVPGLFDGEEWPKLMHEIREGVNAAGSASSYVDLSSEQDMYKWFITNVQLYLHVVFTMNPHSPDFHNRSATSPALFNRCTIDWFGDWSPETIFQVARELTAKVDVMQGFSGRQQDSEIAHDIVARVMCRVHSTVTKVNENVRAQSANRGTFITPRHFLDYIQHFHALNKEKSGAVEDLQRHLNTGLSKLRETSDSVDEQQKNLTEKEKVLAVSAERAKVMLAKIIDETTKAEAGKKAAIALKAVLEEESKTLNEQRATVEEQLGDAEPALLDAEKALNTIKPEHLREIRAYATPPPLVKKVLEAVITVMGEKRAGEWEVIKQYTRKDDFIGQVKAFKSSEITDAARDRINKNFLSDPNFTYDAAMRSSKAAGPLQKWVSAQVRFSEIYSSVAPMREKIDALSAEYDAKLAGLTKAEADIEENDASIAKLKSDYEVNTTETAQIRAEIAMVGDRCKRAKALMEKLLAEKTRWEEQSANFRAQSASVLGDCLISAAFLAYIGYFDELNRRQNIIPEWQDVIDEAQIDFARDLSVIEYLSKPEDRLKWQSNKLPQDSLCVENAIIMERYNRYPLIIDPSGQAVDFLLNYMKDKNITKTSFLDKAFMKHLEMAVRVGYPILVQDVEFIDPVLNPLLNREIRRIGGRRVVRLGAQDIDISPTFQLYMSTRDSSFQFAPDVCGRSAMVNFTVTLSSLQSQCMHSVMLQERPDIDEKRTDLMKLQGEYLFRLRMLEQQLLKTISDAEGNILENDALIKTLETLKSESAEIQTKMGQSNLAYQEISDVEEKYTPMAAAASRLYFSLSNLTELNSIYRFSLRFFFDVIKSSISDLPTEFATDDRIPVIIRNIFTIAHYRVTRSLFQEDHLAFELRLAQLRCSVGDQISRQVQTPEWDMLLTTTASPNVKADSIAALPGTIPRTLSQALLAQAVTLLSNSSFMSVKQSLCKTSNDEKWGKFFAGTTDPLMHIPDDAFDDGVSASRRAFLIALLAKVTRPDMFTVAAEAFLTTFFDCDARGTSVVEQYKQERFLSTQAGFTVEQALNDLTSSVPLLLVAAAGYDASGRVEDLARQTGMSLQVVAMGSPEGYEEANSFVSQGMRLGSWVLLKNVHLASQFLATLEKRIHSEQLEGRINQNFRLFLSSEPSEKIPHSLVMASVVMVFEPPPGIKSNMLRVLNTIKPSQIPQYPKELPRLYFIAAWLHSVVMERMNYLPLGWSKRYEFSEADFRRVIGTIESWVGIVRGDRHHVPPEELPWPAIRTLVADTIYGGRIDNSFDQILLESFCSTFFTPAAFGPKFNFIASTENPLTCDGITMDDFNTWAANLPVVQSPEWLGLPSTATEMVLIQRANRTMERLIKIQNVFLEESSDDKGRGGSSSPARGQSVGKEETGARWAQKLLKSLQVWQDIIGKATFKPVPITSATSIALALKRESSVGEKLLEKVRLDITEMMDVCRGTLKPNNYHRTLIEAFSKELVPSNWNRYTVPPSLTLRTWLLDFKLRLDRLQGLLAVKESELHKHPIHMGSLFFPEAFLTATRQSVARHNNLALEKLELQLLLFSTPADAPPPKESDITLVGLTLFSAQLNKHDIISPIAEQRVATSQIPLARLTWQTKEAVAERLKGAAVADFPLYLSADRVTNLGKITLPVDTKVPVESWYQRGSCLTIWSADEK